MKLNIPQKTVTPEPRQVKEQRYYDAPYSPISKPGGGVAQKPEKLNPPRGVWGFLC